MPGRGRPYERRSSEPREPRPAAQAALADAIFALGKPVVLLLTSGPLMIAQAAERVQAVAATWFLGAEAGHAIADVLTGKFNLVGRLPITWPRDIGQVPIYFSRRPSGRPAAADNPYTSKYLDSRLSRYSRQAAPRPKPVDEVIPCRIPPWAALILRAPSYPAGHCRSPLSRRPFMLAASTAVAVCDAPKWGLDAGRPRTDATRVKRFHREPERKAVCASAQRPLSFWVEGA